MLVCWSLNYYILIINISKSQWLIIKTTICKTDYSVYQTLKRHFTRVQNKIWALASVSQWIVQWIECRPVNQRVASLIPGQSTCLGCGPDPQYGVHMGQPQINVSLPLPPSLPLSLKINEYNLFQNLGRTKCILIIYFKKWDTIKWQDNTMIYANLVRWHKIQLVLFLKKTKITFSTGYHWTGTSKENSRSKFAWHCISKKADINHWLYHNLCVLLYCLIKHIKAI